MCHLDGVGPREGVLKIVGECLESKDDHNEVATPSPPSAQYCGSLTKLNTQYMLRFQ